MPGGADGCLLQAPHLAITETVLKEGVSGAKPISARAGGTHTDRQRHPGAKHIITTKLDRLFRHCEDALKMSRHWGRADVALHVLDTPGLLADSVRVRAFGPSA
jgi:hypothetical protein